MTGHLPRERVVLRRIQGLIDALVHGAHVGPVRGIQRSVSDASQCDANVGCTPK